VADKTKPLPVIKKLDGLLARTHDKRRPAKSLLAPENVHLLRTSARRLEALLKTQDGQNGREGRKLEQRLKRLRKQAGQVRDLDIQLAALCELKMGRQSEDKARLMQSLAQRRNKRERALVKVLADKDTQKLRKALRRWSGKRAEDAPAAAAREQDAFLAVLRDFAGVARQAGSLTPDNLHAFRTRCKQIRYVTELAGKGPEVKSAVKQLKRIQDVAGDWHDWQSLRQTAGSFSKAPDRGLVAALRTVTDAKFVEARKVCQDATRLLLAQYEALQAQPSGLPARKAAAAVTSESRMEVA
jgi:CHAD domain-containing protein